MLESTLGITLRSQLGLDVSICNILVSGVRVSDLIDKVTKIAAHQLPGTNVLRELEEWAFRARKAAQHREHSYPLGMDKQSDGRHFNVDRFPKGCCRLSLY